MKSPSCSWHQLSYPDVLATHTCPHRLWSRKEDTIFSAPHISYPSAQVCKELLRNPSWPFCFRTGGGGVWSSVGWPRSFGPRVQVDLSDTDFLSVSSRRAGTSLTKTNSVPCPPFLLEVIAGERRTLLKQGEGARKSSELEAFGTTGPGSQASSCRPGFSTGPQAWGGGLRPA